MKKLRLKNKGEDAENSSEKSKKLPWFDIWKFFFSNPGALLHQINLDYARPIFPYADHDGCVSYACASQFCTCASFLQKTYLLQSLIQREFLIRTGFLRVVPLIQNSRYSNYLLKLFKHVNYNRKKKIKCKVKLLMSHSRCAEWWFSSAKWCWNNRVIRQNRRISNWFLMGMSSNLDFCEKFYSYFSKFAYFMAACFLGFFVTSFILLM